MHVVSSVVMSGNGHDAWRRVLQANKNQPTGHLVKIVATSLLLVAAGLGFLELPTVVLALLAWGLSGRRVPPSEIS